MSTESPLLTEVLSEVTVGEPSAWKALQVFPLVHPNASRRPAPSSRSSSSAERSRWPRSAKGAPSRPSRS